MPLTDTAIKNAKPKDRPYKLSDERGLFVLVNSSGSKLFRLKYRFDGKEKLLALGAYPSLSLKEARRLPGKLPAWPSLGALSLRRRPRLARRCQLSGRPREHW